MTKRMKKPSGPWCCPSCGMNRAAPNKVVGRGQIAPGAVHLTVGSVVDGWKVRPERDGDVCRAWSSGAVYRQYLATRTDHESDLRDQ